VPLDLLPRALLFALSAWVLLDAPGRALIRRGDTSLPAAFARLLASVIVSTLVGTALAGAERFSLANLLIGNLGLAVVLLALRWRLGPAHADREVSASRDLVGPAVFALALAAYWPAYPAFLGASDSTAYVASGISLAHHGSLSRNDELGPTVPMALRQELFDSMSQVLGSKGPPYRRMPGAMLVESLDATKAWPAFFPVPSVWAAMFVAAGAPGGEKTEEAAPGYAPVFAAMALWSFWLLARQWLGRGWGLAAVVLLGASGPFYTAAKLPMSEPIAAYFALSGIAILTTAFASGRRDDDARDAEHGPGPRRLDSVLAGAALGAAVFTRIEVALILAMAFAMLPTLLAPRSHSGGARHPLTPGFFVALLAVSSLTIAQAMLLPGTYLSPLLDHLQNAYIMYVLHVGYVSFGIPGDHWVMGAALFALVARLFGISATLRWGFVFAVLGGHAAASRFLVERTPMWLSFYVGWTGLALAAAGVVMAYRERVRRPELAMGVAVATAAALILFYNPHVYPSLPWGARRFVPLLLPMLVLLGCYAAANAAYRSRLIAVVCVGLLAFPVVQGGRPAWGERMMEGAWSQLDQLAASIPEGGTLLVDRQVSPMMIGPTLWLIYDRNGISVPPTSGAVGREIMTKLVSHYGKQGPLYFVTRGAGNQLQPPNVKMERIASVSVSLRLLEQNYDTRPERIDRFVMPLAVYRLGISDNPRAATVK